MQTNESNYKTVTFNIPLSLLLHLPRGRADHEAALAAAAVSPALHKLGITLRRVPTQALPSAMHDTASDEVLCADSSSSLPPPAIKSLQWAVHKRHQHDIDHVHRQLVCDLNGGDESRVRRKPVRGGRKQRPA